MGAIDERDFNPDTELAHDMLWSFASVPSSKPQAESNMDNDIIKVRYAYDGSKSPEREFCRKMMSANRVYRKEDLVGPYYPEQLGGASARAVNPGFGPNGTDTYDILLFKGGPNCHHRWIRRTYLKKNNQRISVSRARQIISQLPEDVRRANPLPPNDDPRVSQWPSTMPNHGYLNPR